MAIEPVTREERFLAAAGGQSVTPPTPITRKEQLLQGIIDAVKSGGASPDAIKEAVNAYLDENPVAGGATAEQATQIEQNKTDIADLQTEVDELKESSGGGPGAFAVLAEGELAEVATIRITDFDQTLSEYVFHLIVPKASDGLNSGNSTFFGANAFTYGQNFGNTTYAVHHTYHAIMISGGRMLLSRMQIHCNSTNFDNAHANGSTDLVGSALGCNLSQGIDIRCQFPAGTKYRLEGRK